MEKHATLALMKKSLDLERFDPPEKIEWLENSYDGESDFWPELCKQQDSLLGNTGKSRPFKQYDFFYDLITRNCKRETPAFIWYDPVNHWKKVSYQTLGERAELISNHWRNSGVLPGVTLCIIKQFGIGYLETLLAGLRTGVVLSFIMPEGKSLIDKKLEALQPDYISTDPMYHPLLSSWQEKILIDENIIGKIDTKIPSHTYMAGEVVARLFDPMCQDMFTPKTVLSDLFYLSGIRDGLVGLGLSPGNIFAAPGFNTGLTQPSFIFSVLLNGATYLHLSMKHIQKDPDLLTIYPLKVLGVISALRDILIASPARRVRIWDSWFRDPSDACDMHVWELFIKKLELTDIPAGCMMWNTAMGGCLLFSRKRRGQALQNVTPMPGRKWQLAMTEDDTTQALGDLGLFCVNAFLKGDEESYLPTPCILAQTYLENLFVGFNLSTRKGMYYPKELVAKIVQTMTVCCGTVVVEILTLGGTASKFHLLVFTGNGQTIDPAAVIKEIHQAITSKIGKKFFVDDIRLFPLFPRRTEENHMDEDWCVSQYLTGRLKSKSKNDLFLGLSRMRELALGPHNDKNN